MVKNIDHVTVAVHDAEAGLRFFALLGFREVKSVVITGSPFAEYMGVPGIEAEHRTLVLENATPRFEIQLLTYRQPAVHADRRPATWRAPASTTSASRWTISTPRSPA